MRVYLATSFQNIPEFLEVKAALTAAGHTLTHDWSTETADTFEQFQACGARDIQGIDEADALVLINHEALRDGMFEFGFAVGQGCPVIVLHPDRRLSVFFHRARSLCASVEELLTALEGLE
jgi:nucleoside 2-deoxyribosyltransferase